MNVLLIGSGGREHRIAMSLAKSPKCTQLYIAPGNPGTSECGANIPISDSDLPGLLAFAKENNIDCTFVGPEVPLVAGIVDLFKEHELPIIGPSKEAAQLEGSKDWAKKLMKKHNIPTADFQTFTELKKAIDYVKNKNQYPIVIKADGLAAGKGVTVALNEKMAITAINDCFSGKFKEAGEQVVIEDFLAGEEASIFAFTDGKTVYPMLPAQDHKAIYDGDTGPNTGGMGAYCPAPLISEEMQETILNTVFKPLLSAFQEEKLHYTGIIYAGLMISPKGEINIVEFNVRFGDPETQAVLALLETDLLDIFTHINNQTLDQINLTWKKEFATCVVLASKGYPEQYEKGFEIYGSDTLKKQSHIQFIHAGTSQKSNQLVTNGGRVANIVASAETLEKSIAEAYKYVSNISFDNCVYRTDIGKKGLKHAPHLS